MGSQTEFFWSKIYRNGLEEKLGRDFFRALPKEPGVYVMLGKQREVLYVGKSKNLRARLGSYRQAKADRVSRKVLRMVNLVEEIQIELCVDEKAALLRENELLRRHRPPFNVMNVRPESYYFIGLRASGGTLELKLTTKGEAEEGMELFGAYKGRHTIRDGYSALLRLLWACHHEIERFFYPALLVRDRPMYEWSLEVGEEAVSQWMPLIRRYLRGTSRKLLEELTACLLLKTNIPAFMYRTIQEDLERAEALYLRGPWRNRRARRVIGEPTGGLIAQERLDDLMVEAAFESAARTELKKAQ